MRERLRRIVAALLAGAILLAGSGFNGAVALNAVAVELERGLGIEPATQQSAPAHSGESGSADHGCAGHLTSHLLTLTESRPLAFVVEPASAYEPHPASWPPAARPDSFFRPPRFSLA